MRLGEVQVAPVPFENTQPAEGARQLGIVRVDPLEEADGAPKALFRGHQVAALVGDVPQIDPGHRLLPAGRCELPLQRESLQKQLLRLGQLAAAGCPAR